jgi:hypothetical protein
MGKYLDKLKQLNQQPVTGPTVHPGDQIIWTRGDGTTQTGVVDSLHVDDAGVSWAFVSLGESWAAVNLKFVTGTR